MRATQVTEVHGEEQKMPYAQNDGSQVWYETEGEGPPLVLHTGFFGSLEDWRLPDTNYVAALKDVYRLVLLDPRGQGRSDKPHDPSAYTLATRAGDVIAVLDRLGIERAAFWGYSLGGRVGFELAARYPERLTSMIAGGANLYRAVDPDTDVLVSRLRVGMGKVVEEWERGLGPLPKGVRDRWLANDATALAAAWLAPSEASFIIDALPGMTTPTLLYVGGDDREREPIARPAAFMPDATLVTLPGLNHSQAFYGSTPILSHATRFLSQHAVAPA